MNSMTNLRWKKHYFSELNEHIETLNLRYHHGLRGIKLLKLHTDEVVAKKCTTTRYPFLHKLKQYTPSESQLSAAVTSNNFAPQISGTPDRPIK